VFCCDCGHAVCVLCAVDSKKCKAHATEAFDTVIDELRQERLEWSSAAQECERCAEQLCGAIQADGDAKKLAIDTQIAALLQQVRSVAAARCSAMRDIAEKRQEREEEVAAAAAAPEVGCRGSAAAAAVLSAIHRAKAPVPPASPAKFLAAAAPDAAVGNIDAAEAVVDPEDAAARAAAEAAKKRTVTLNRSATSTGSWSFSSGADALTISVSAPASVCGISLCKWISGSSTGNVDVYVIEGLRTSGRVLAHRLLPDVVLNTGSVVPLMLEQPVQLAPDTDYTLVLRMQGDMQHERLSAPQSSIASTTSAGAPFTLTIKDAVFDGPSPNLNSTNCTTAANGQIPSIFLSC
jgi:hypothetical protein